MAVSALMKQAERAARKGAKYLDAKKPGWAGKIALTKLDMGNGSACILGQCYTAFYKGLRELGENEEDNYDPCSFAVRHGFQVSMALQEKGHYERLAAAWAPLIFQRQFRAMKRNLGKD